MTGYPPEPWHLAGQAYLSVWRVPVNELPELPEGVEPAVMGGRAQVFGAWIDYQEPGQLQYHELLATVAVRGKRLSSSITDIWVDSEVSLAGGRALWGIPKDLAALDFTHGRTFTASAATHEDWIATAAFTARPSLPVKLPAAFDVVQNLDGRLKKSPVLAVARPHPAAADWKLNENGPLGFLAGQRPVLSAHLRDFKIVFGG
ncbi:acetoacetate decarboxylase family protein [Amycolatopsis sp. NPDC051071]|uniref:acetoacetate decarboxylase family protein n=1 Tax=Amycolatopsis sp. NPDC051071 TaxID=3154637 RepID=UPI00344A3902